MKTLNYLSIFLLLLGGFNAQSQTSLTATHIEEILDDELPVVGVRYQFYPNLDAYYDLQSNVHIYIVNGVWVKTKDLPTGYRGYSIMNNIKVEITDYNGDQPQTKLASHQQQFPKNYSAKRKPPKKDAAPGSKTDTKLAFN